MKIHIEKYRNIDKLDYELEDGKVNFLFGVCGAGKSSILSAISSNIDSTDIAVGCDPDETVVLVDDSNPDLSAVQLYGLDQQHTLFQESASGEHYEIFIGQEDALLKLENEFNQSIKDLRDNLDSLYAFRGKVQELQKSIGTTGAKGNFTPGSKFGKLRSAIQNAKPYAKEVVEEYGLKFAEWRNQGFTINDFYINDKCPFCDQTLSSNLKESLDELKDLELKDIKPLFSSSTLMKDLKISEPDFTKPAEVEATEKQITDIYVACAEIDKIIKFCTISRDTALLQGGLNDLDVNEIVYAYFPDLENVVEKINEQSSTLKEMVGKMKATFEGLINTNSKELNNQLKSLGIPYFFTVQNTDRNNKTTSYILKHKKSSISQDMRDSLSTGERNLIALLLFLYRKDKDVILIDDPASSFDDYRRSQIFRSIMDNEGKTVLVVSHDQAFVKRAVREQGTNKRIGKIQMLSCCSNQPSLIDVTRNSFGNLDEFVKNRIVSAKTYYQKVVNLRLYCDIHKAQVGEIIWGYSSAILHGLTKEEIDKLLGKLGATEEDVLENLESRFDIKFEPIPTSYMQTLTEDFSNFERLICLRESLKRKKDKGLTTQEENIEIDMLDDLVHMNDSMLFCLNPYEYHVWSPSLEKTLTPSQATNK